MSDEDNDIDVESEDDEDRNNQPRTFTSLVNKRAHHNALERKRRDHIKESFAGLRDSVPALVGEKGSHQPSPASAEPLRCGSERKLSRAQILHKAAEHIQHMRRKNHAHQADIEQLKRLNMMLEHKIRQLEKSRACSQLAVDPSIVALPPQDYLSIPPASSGIVSPTMAAVKPDAVIAGPNSAGDHDGYTMTPKRVKSGP